MRVTKRLIDIDDELLAAARKASGASTIKATVEIALRRLVDRSLAVEHVMRLRQGNTLDLAKLEEARKPRHG